MAPVFMLIMGSSPPSHSSIRCSGSTVMFLYGSLPPQISSMRRCGVRKSNHTCSMVEASPSAKDVLRALDQKMPVYFQRPPARDMQCSSWPPCHGIRTCLLRYRIPEFLPLSNEVKISTVSPKIAAVWSSDDADLCSRLCHWKGRMLEALDPICQNEGNSILEQCSFLQRTSAVPQT